MGDSITHGGHYVGYLQLLCELRCHDKGMQVVNCGVGGESAGVALGRFGYDVLEERPDVIVVMFGMNDVGRQFYGPSSISPDVTDLRRKALVDYEANMRKIVRQAHGRMKKVVLVTPTPYDEYGERRKDVRRTDCNEKGLSQCAEIVRKLGVELDVEVIDLHRPLTEILRKHVETSVLADRVHPASAGAIMIAGELFLASGQDGTVAEVEIAADGSLRKSEDATVSEIAVSKEKITFRYAPEKLPLPRLSEYDAADALWGVTERLNREIIRVTGLSDGLYELSFDGRRVSLVTAAELQRGVNVALLDTPNARVAEAVAKDIGTWISYESAWRHSFIVKRKIAAKGGDPRTLEGILRVTDEKDREAAVKEWKWMSWRREQAVCARNRMHELAKPVDCHVEVALVRRKAGSVYVSPNGDDASSGERESPLKTLVAARNVSRLRRVGEDVLLPGEYPVDERIVLDECDDGLVIRSEKAGAAVLQGGVPLTNWRTYIGRARARTCRERRSWYRAYVTSSRLRHRRAVRSST